MISEHQGMLPLLLQLNLSIVQVAGSKVGHSGLRYCTQEILTDGEAVELREHGNRMKAIIFVDTGQLFFYRDTVRVRDR